jgi:hypothetical protein
MTRPLAELPMAVVLASIDAPRSWRGSIEGWLRELDGHGEVVVVDASGDATAHEIAARYPQVRVLRGAPCRLAPELWRDGLAATDQPLVALSTTQMVPEAGWRPAMLRRLEATSAAVAGGPIKPSERNNVIHRAIYLLRYVNYLPPLPAAGAIEPPGENAVYLRERLTGLESLWAKGFWEVEVHGALRARGERTVMTGEPAVTYHGERRLFRVVQERYRHACCYGASRSRRFGPAHRLMRVATAPLVPAVLLVRIAHTLRARSAPLVPWLPELPFLLLLLAAWSLGEARGMGTGLLASLWTYRFSYSTSLDRLSRLTRRYWHGRQRTRSWFSGGGGRVPGGAAGRGGDGCSGLPAGGRL